VCDQVRWAIFPEEKGKLRPWTGQTSQSNLSGRLRCVAKVSIGMRHHGGNQQRTSISGRRTRAVVSLLQCPTSAPLKQRFWAANSGSLNWSPAVLASAHVRVECGGTAASGFRSDDCRLPSHVLLVPADVPALNPHPDPVPQGGVHLIVVCLFDHSNALPQNASRSPGLIRRSSPRRTYHALQRCTSRSSRLRHSQSGCTKAARFVLCAGRRCHRSRRTVL